MILLGVDPGLEHTAFAVLRDGVPVAHGYLKTKRGTAHAERLDAVYKFVVETIRQWEPDAMALEDAFFIPMRASGLKETFKAIGVCEAAAARCEVPVVIFPPSETKSAISGRGNANKDEVKEAVKKMVPEQLFKAYGKGNEHIYDAYAAAFTYHILRRN